MEEGDLNILSITCPTGVEDEEVEVIGEHTLVKPLKREIVEPLIKETEDAPPKVSSVSRECMSTDLINLLEFHKMRSVDFNKGLNGPYAQGYRLGEGPKQLGYFPPIGKPVELIISNACASLHGRLELTSSGGYIDGERIPNSSIIEPIAGINLDAPDEARYFADMINDLAQGTDVDSLDGTQVYEAMIAQDAITRIQRAKRDAMRVAPDGYYYQNS